MDSELNAKEVAFNKIIQWLRDYGFSVYEERRNKDVDAEVQFQAKIYPPNQTSLFFQIVFAKRFPDAFSMQSSVSLPGGVQ
jgi:hypothetical protein